MLNIISRVRRRLENAPSKNSSPSGAIHRQIKIDGRGSVLSVAFLVDGRHIVSGGQEGKIRRWRVKDGKEVGIPLDAGSTVRSVAVSRDGKWVVSGTESGEVMVWNLESHEKVIAFKGHGDSVCAVDVSPDGTKIATGSHDLTACIWFLSTGQRVLGPLKHSDKVAAVKFSPDGRLIATATWNSDSIQVYDSQDSRLLVDTPIQVSSPVNHSLVWTSNSKQLFVLPCDGNVSNVDVSTGTTRFQWPIHSSSGPGCIAIAGNGTFIAASSDSSISFWDTMTREQIGSVITHTATIQLMAISANYDLAVCGGETITLHSLRDIHPPSYFDNILAEHIRHIQVEKADLEEKIEFLRAQVENSKNTIVRLEERVRQLSDSQRAAAQHKDGLNETTESLHAQDGNLNDQITCLKENVHQLHCQLDDARHTVSGLNEIMQLLRAQETNSNNKIADLEQQLCTQHAYSLSGAGSFINAVDAHDQKHQCEALYAEARIIDAALSLLKITNTVSEGVRANKPIMDWLTAFKSRCISALEEIGDKASNIEKQEAAEAYSTALLLSHSIPNADALLLKWANSVSIRSSVNEEPNATAKCKLPRFTIYRTICEVLMKGRHISGAVECLRQMQYAQEEGNDNHNGRAQLELGEGGQRRLYDTTDSFGTTTNIPEKMDPEDHVKWVTDFKVRCLKKLRQHGDAAMALATYEDAAALYTTALTLDPLSTYLLIKRSEARARFGSWEDSLEDATAAIKLDPSSLCGYERMHAALFGTRRYDEAIQARKDMFKMIEQLRAANTQDSYDQYASPEETMEAIRKSARKSQQHAPLVLINTETGCLCDKEKRLDEFQASQDFKELVASTTKRLDDSCTTEIIRQYFRYATLSHTWEGANSLFDVVLHKSIYKLANSSRGTVSKMVNFCMKAKEARLLWAWSDICCINQNDPEVLKESLTSMFQWYYESAVTLVHLNGVQSNSMLCTLFKSLWNTRAWTLQEFFASQVIRFYTEDWELYRHETKDNHKCSDAIMEEMKAVTRVDVQVLRSLQPGSENDVRQKLCLAAGRDAKYQEDKAYSLLGIFKVQLDIHYGERQESALGRLLEKVLTRSGDATILAWTGNASSYNSCLPAEITAYHEPAPPHIPSLIQDNEMNELIEELQKSTFRDSAVELYNRVFVLPWPQLVHGRLSLSCIVFPLEDLQVSPLSSHSQHVYRIKTHALREVEIKTMEVLPSSKQLVLVHPWLGCLLDLVADKNAQLPTFLVGEVGDSDVLCSRALQLFAYLRQSFGALLLLTLKGNNRYKRIACDTLITMQLKDNISPQYLAEKIPRQPIYIL